MSDSTIRVSRQTSKKLGHIAIDAEINKKDLLGLIAENLKYDQSQQRLKLDIEV